MLVRHVKTSTAGFSCSQRGAGDELGRLGSCSNHSRWLRANGRHTRRHQLQRSNMLYGLSVLLPAHQHNSTPPVKGMLHCCLVPTASEPPAATPSGDAHHYPVCRCPQLTYLSMAGAVNTRMPNLDEAPALVALDLSRCSKLAEASTRATLMRLTGLRELSVSGISNFLDQTVQHVSGVGLAGMLPGALGLQLASRLGRTGRLHRGQCCSGGLGKVHFGMRSTQKPYGCWVKPGGSGRRAGR